MDLFALATVPAGPDEAGEPPPTNFYTLRDNLPYSALAANGNLCTAKGGLKMPTAFVAQNGAVLDQDAHRDVTGYTKLKLHKQALRAAVGVC